MLNRNFIIESVNGSAPYDGARLILECRKGDGLTICEVRGFSSEEVRRIDPDEAIIHKAGEGSYNAWTGRRHGTWDVYVYDRWGATRLRMKGKRDALNLKGWIEKYAARKGGK